MRTTLLAALLAALILPGAHAATPAGAGKPAAVKKAPVEIEKVVYHINDAANARLALNNVNNHLNAEPDVKIVVVAHGKGIDFLLNDARDEKGAFEPQIAALKDRGVDFRVCRNTLKSRNLGEEAVILEAHVVPSGVAEIARLQAREGFVYLKP